MEILSWRTDILSRLSWFWVVMFRNHLRPWRQFILVQYHFTEHHSSCTRPHTFIPKHLGHQRGLRVPEESRRLRGVSRSFYTKAGLWHVTRRLRTLSAPHRSLLIAARPEQPLDTSPVCPSVPPHHLHPAMAMDGADYVANPGDHLVWAFPGLLSLGDLPLVRVGRCYQIWSPTWTPAELARLARLSQQALYLSLVWVFLQSDALPLCWFFRSRLGVAITTAVLTPLRVLLRPRSPPEDPPRFLPLLGWLGSSVG
jgi:hypothetical protein